MKTISDLFHEHVTENVHWSKHLGPTDESYPFFMALLAVLNQYQEDIEKRLAKTMREGKEAKPFYDCSGGR